MFTKIAIFFGGIKDTLVHTFWMFWIMIKTLVLTVWSSFVAFMLGLGDSFLAGCNTFQTGLDEAAKKASEMSKTISDTLHDIFS